MENLIKGQVLVDASYIGKTRQIYLKTMYRTEFLLADVRAALEMVLGHEVEDYSVLASTIFFEMTKRGGANGISDFGIGCDIVADLDILITLDYESKTVFVEYQSDKEKWFTQTFEEFAKGISPVELLDKTEEPAEPDVQTGSMWLCRDCGDEFEVPRDANIPDIVCATCASINIEAK